MGEERPSEVHGGGGECSAANAEEEGDNDTQDVLGAVTEGAEVVRVSCTPTACCCSGSGHGRGRSRWIGSRHVLGFILIYSFDFDVFCW